MVHFVLYRTILVFIAISLCSPEVFAETTVSGDLAGEVRWAADAGPYLVNGSVGIGPGATLTIGSGTIIYMASGAGIYVRGGRIEAQGSAENPIRVLSDKARQGLPGAPGDWMQWAFETSSVSSRLDYVLFEYGRGLAVNGAALELNFVELRNHAGAAITVDLLATLSGVGNRASGNALNAVAVPEGTVTGNARWGLRGIPFVVGGGGLSVGVPPSIGALTPNVAEQGERLTLTLSGSRLSGLSDVVFEQGVTDVSVLPGGDDRSAGLSLVVAPGAVTGSVGMQAMTDAGSVSFPVALRIEGMRPPVVTGLTPRAISRGQETGVVISGSSLGAATVTAATPGITISGLSATRNALSFRVGVAGEVPTGIHPLSVANGAGVVPLALEVLPEVTPPPPFQVVPAFVTLAADATFRRVTLRANGTATVDRQFNAGIVDGAVAKLRETTLTLPAGQYETHLAIAGVSVGNTSLQIAGDGLAVPLEAPLTVTSAGQGEMQVSRSVGVIRGGVIANGSTLAFSSPVRVDRGSAWNAGSTLSGFSRGVRVDRGNSWNGGGVQAISPMVGVIRE